MDRTLGKRGLSHYILGSHRECNTNKGKNDTLFQDGVLKNHTLLGRTYLSSPYTGDPLPPPAPRPLPLAPRPRACEPPLKKNQPMGQKSLVIKRPNFCFGISFLIYLTLIKSRTFKHFRSILVTHESMEILSLRISKPMKAFL